MRRPRRRGTAISDVRIEEWLERFNAFRDTPTKSAIERWVNRFDARDRDIAARLLDSVEVISSQKIRSAFRRILQSLPGWSSQAQQRSGKWVFVAREISTGTSGSSMIHAFRTGTGMASSKHDKLFRHVSELPSLGLGPADNVVFVDDFSGTGDQVCDEWPMMKELVANRPNLFLVLIVIPTETLQRIEDKTDYKIHCDITIEQEDSVFSNRCKYFNDDEKIAIENYCRKIKQKEPRGYGGRGFVLVFHHGCPNNSLPILNSNNSRWYGLFPRYDFDTRRRT